MVPVQWCEQEAYGPFEAEARERMKRRDESGWPTVALALCVLAARPSSRVAVWSQDKDFSAAGVETWTTGQSLDALRV
jgi:predicted nucleic acid-binding protein